MNEHPENFFDLKPRRLIDWELDLEGRAVLFRPKFGSGPLGKLLAHWLGPSNHRIRLETVGTAVWLGLDGNKTLSVLLQELREEFGSSIEPANQRLKIFIEGMIQKLLIEVR